MPCTIRHLAIPKPSAGFYDFEEYEQLIAVAKAMNRTAHLIVLLAGEAGLRCGEIVALEWGDVDLAKRQLCVQRSEWRGHVGVPKGGRLRYVPLTARLATALRDHRHLRSQRVICRSDGSSLSQDMIGDLSTTQRYMHLSPAAIEGAIRLLEQPRPRIVRGDLWRQPDRDKLNPCPAVI